MKRRKKQKNRQVSTMEQNQWNNAQVSTMVQNQWNNAQVSTMERNQWNNGQVSQNQWNNMQGQAMNIEEQVQSQNRVQRRKKRKVLKVIRTIMLLIIFAGIIIFTLTTPIFNVMQVEVSGNEKISSTEITSLSQIKKGENIFKYKKEQIIQNVKENPYIKTVKISKRYPNCIQIEVTERHTKMMVQLLNSYAYIDSQGYILQISEEKEPVTLIKGCSTEENNIQPGKRLEKADLEKLGDVLKIIKSTKDIEILDKITYIDIAEENEYKLYLENERKTVYLGDVSNISDKMLYLKKILEKEAEYEGEIFLNGNLNEGFDPYFREKV